MVITNQGDEPMAGQNNSGSNSLDENNDSIISSNIIFRGSVLRQIEEKRKPRRYIYIGTVRVEITIIFGYRRGHVISKAAGLFYCILK